MESKNVQIFHCKHINVNVWTLWVNRIFLGAIISADGSWFYSTVSSMFTNLYHVTWLQPPPITPLFIIIYGFTVEIFFFTKAAWDKWAPLFLKRFDIDTTLVRSRPQFSSSFSFLFFARHKLFIAIRNRSEIR